MTTLSWMLAAALAAAPVVPEGPAAPPRAPTPRKAGDGWLAAGVAGFGVGAFGLGLLAAGLALGREAATARNDEARRLNGAPAAPTAAELARLDLWAGQGRQANAIAIVGGVLLGVGAVLGGALLGRGLVLRRRAGVGPGPGAGLRFHLVF